MASNQLVVNINKELADKDHIYAVINQDAMQKAAMELKDSSFKLWLYLAKNSKNERWTLSQKACERWGIKKDSYYRGIAQLKEKRYLIEKGNSEFDFYETPKTLDVSDF